MTCGIYCIENIVNGKKYIGQSKDLKKRKREHYSLLRRNCHGNRYLQRAWNKYGEDNFEFKILLLCKESELTKYEMFFDNKCKEKNSSYNIRDCVDSNKGFRHSEKTKNILKEKSTGRRLSQDTRDKISEKNKGRIKTADHRKKLQESGMGHPVSSETRLKISQSKIGKSHIISEKTKINMAAAAKNRAPISNHVREKMSKSAKNRPPISEETRMKLSENMKNRWRKKHEQNSETQKCSS